MDLTPLLDAPLAVQLHVATVVPAIFLGGWLIVLSRERSPGHRGAGAVYLVLMTVTAFAALLAIRHRDVRAHKSAMLGVFIGGILIAGGLAFMPGRIMYRLFVGG